MFNFILMLRYYVPTTLFLYETYFNVFVKENEKYYNKLNDNYKLIN